MSSPTLLVSRTAPSPSARGPCRFELAGMDSVASPQNARRHAGAPDCRQTREQPPDLPPPRPPFRDANLSL